MAKKNYPVMKPYNPLDKKELGTSIMHKLLETDVCPLPPDPFIGAGVYALYYTGSFPAYAALAQVNQNEEYACPIYVGKAVPNGARKGGQGDIEDPGTVLHKRLSDHAKSINAAVNLNLSDFCCRYLSVDDIWIPLAESILIERFKPVWNRVLDGFGNHDPGKGRHAGKISDWDCVHPGRPWVAKLQAGGLSPAELEKAVVNYLKDALDE